MELGASRLSLSSIGKPFSRANCPAPAPTNMLCLVRSITHRATDNGRGKLHRVKGSWEGGRDDGSGGWVGRGGVVEDC